MILPLRFASALTINTNAPYGASVADRKILAVSGEGTRLRSIFHAWPLKSIACYCRTPKDPRYKDGAVSDDHYMPLFVGDFLASTATWTGPERGLYVQMLMLSWSTSSLPCEPRRLCRVLGYDWAEFEPLWAIVRPKFTNGGATLTNTRLEQIRERSKEISTARARSGSAGATARWNGKQDGKRMANAIELPPDPMANATDLPMANAWQKNAIQSISNPIQSRTKEEPENPDRAAEQPDDDEWISEFKANYPKRAGSQRWPQALKCFHARLREGCTRGEMLAGAIRYAEYIRESGKAGTPYVLQAATFLGPDKHFLEPWIPPSSKAQIRQDENITAVQTWLENSR